jgi:hypothetical protein
MNGRSGLRIVITGAIRAVISEKRIKSRLVRGEDPSECLGREVLQHTLEWHFVAGDALGWEN